MNLIIKSVACSAIAIGIAAMSSSVRAQGVRFTLAPSAEYIWWDSSLRLEDAPLFGGRLSADFGSLLSVSGYYHRANTLGVSRDSLMIGGGRQLGPLRTNTDVTTFGGNLAVRLSPARLAPFVSAGAGVIRFDADSVPRRDQINYRYGAGFQYDPTPNLRAMVMVEDSRFRLAPGALFTSSTGGISSTDRRTTRSNWTASAGLGLAIGGAVDGGDDERTERWSVASVPLEAFAGRLDFDDPSLARQAMIGARGGVDIGQYVGLRGFYWQGRSGNLRERQPMQSYGGEAQFNFTRSRGPSPFLVLGAGRLDFGEAYRDTDGRGREVETALIAGAGVAFRLTDNFRLNVAVRDYVRGPQELDSVATTDQLTNNWMYTVGLGFDLGRSRRRIADRDDRDNRDIRDDRDSDRLVERITRNAERRRLTRDTVGSRVERPIMIMLPAPTVGEIYVRYGDSTQRTMRVLPPMMPPMQQMPPMHQMGDSNATRQSSDAVIRQLRLQIDSLEARLRNPMLVQPVPAPQVPMRAAPPRQTLMPSDDTGALRIRRVSGYVAGFGQLALGVQLDVGTVLGMSQLRLVPDVAIGVGEDPSVSVAIGAQYDFAALRMNAPGSYRPFARAGLGFLAAGGNRDSEFGVNLAYGLTYQPVRKGVLLSDDRRPQYFVEHQGINLFSTNRFLMGVRWLVQ